jgi:putative ABC transport system ATP-binding protein
MEPVVNIQGLHHAFDKGQLSKPVLLDINLAIQPGEIVILTGPSGSGKTTLLSLMGGLRSAQQGSLRILDQELLGADQKTARRPAQPHWLYFSSP